jgi:deazaflavin-dependent oxidoreductase (nitroreductase family)
MAILTPELASQLASVRTIDLSTYGRRTNQTRRVEIWWFRFEGRFIISGTPGKRDWLANIRANPAVIIHAVGQDLEATAVEIDDPDFRQRFFTHRDTRWYSTQSQLDRLVATAPMIEVSF